MDVPDTAGRRSRIALLAVLASLAARAILAAGPAVVFNIPAGDFSQAVIEFYKQTNVEILYASQGGVGEIKTHAVVGTLDVSEALTRMLEGTGFTFEFENPHSVLLKRADAAPAVMESVAGTGGDGPSMPAESDADLEHLASATGPQLQDVVITGTFIHGVQDIISPLVHVTKEDLKTTPYASVRDALQALPINSGGGFSDDFAGGTGNYNRGTSVNLRGLGYGSTLVLVDGRRQPLAGSAADFVDLSNIPWNAVQRIEVLPYGTSALYGSDAIAGVVNIVMRDDLEGGETQGRMASAIGGGDEKVFGQLFGRHWNTGKWLASYQFSERGSLAAENRSYAANADKTALGGTDHRSFSGNPGNIIDPNTGEPIAAIPRGQDGTGLTPGDLLPGVVNLRNNFAEYDLTPYRQMHSGLLNGSQKLGNRFELYAEARLSARRAEQRQFQLNQVLYVPNSNPFFVDAYGGLPFVLVAYTFDKDFGPTGYRGNTLSYDSAAGVRGELGDTWRVNLFTSYGRESLRWTEFNVPDGRALEDALKDPSTATAFNPFGDGSATNPETIERIRSNSSSSVVSDIRVASLVVDGSLFNLPAGAARLAVGTEARQENLHQNIADNAPTRFGRDISSVFTELSLPLVGSADESRDRPRLDLSLAGRYEKYSDFGDTFNPKVALRWVPAAWVKLRGSWGTSFKAPKMPDLYDTSQNAAALIVLPDPTSPIKRSLVLIRQGNNPDLKQETASTWTAGIDIAPSMTPGMTASLTYYSIDYEGRILAPGPPSPFEILLQESLWADAITRNPSRRQITDICNQPEYIASTLNCFKSSPAAIVDFRLRNLSITKTRGLDVRVDYSLETEYGAFQVGLSANRALTFDQALSPTAPQVDVVNTVGNPLAFRARGVIGWQQAGPSYKGFHAGATIDRTGGYRDDNTLVPRSVDSFTTLDLRLGFRLGKSGGWANEMDIALNATNVFNQAPPFVDSGFGYDLLNADPVGRVISVYLQKSW